MSQDSCEDEEDYSSSPELTIETPESQDTRPVSESRQKQPKYSRLKRLTCLNVTFNGILAFTTFCLMVIAYWQYDATNEAVKISGQSRKVSEEALKVSQESYRISEQGLRISEQTLKIGERAWVMVWGPKLQSPLAVGEIPSVYLRIQNSGRSPALKVRVRHTFGIDNKLPDGPMPKRPIMGEVSLAVIAPDEYSRSIVPLGLPLTEAHLVRLKHAELSIITYGTITYFDIFGIKHQTSFCLLLRDITKTDLSPCTKWNDAD